MDDEYGAELAGRLKKRLPDLTVYGYGFQRTRRHPHCSFHCLFRRHGSRIQTPWGEGRCRTRLLGRFNAQNLAACIALLCANGYPLDKVLDVLTKIRPASGRMDCIAMNSGKPLVVVDYATRPTH